ncbi:DUF4259 domain-containing protein [Streptomyces niveus]|uniref:DUF4259 domain-containing protein n=1 Tax=Streptomyces niveus TaxID=193462 RepID=UPI0036ECE97F
MGTWGTGPFDSDLAADFVDELEGAIDVLGRGFRRVTDSGERVGNGDGAEVVAADALVASTLPDTLIVIGPARRPRATAAQTASLPSSGGENRTGPGSPPGSATDPPSTRNAH